MDKKIIILGGGSGGIVCANELRKRLSEEHRVMLIDRDESHIFYPSLLWLILGWRKPEQIQRPLSALNKKKVEFIQGEVNGIDLENHLVKVNEQRLNYKVLLQMLSYNRINSINAL